MNGYKQYIRIDDQDIVIHGFSDAFEQPQDDDICVLDDAPRHFHETFPKPLINERGQYRYRWNGTQMVERTQAELDAEWASRPPDPPSPLDVLGQELVKLKLQIAIMGGNF